MGHWLLKAHANPMRRRIHTSAHVAGGDKGANGVRDVRKSQLCACTCIRICLRKLRVRGFVRPCPANMANWVCRHIGTSRTLAADALFGQQLLPQRGEVLLRAVHRQYRAGPFVSLGHVPPKAPHRQKAYYSFLVEPVIVESQGVSSRRCPGRY